MGDWEPSEADGFDTGYLEEFTSRNLTYLIDQVRRDKLSLCPPYQRDYNWKPHNQNGFLNSVFNERTSLDIIIIAHRDSGQSEVMDGKQRLTTYIMFEDEEIPMLTMSGKKVYYSDLSTKAIAILERRNIPVIEIKGGTDSQIQDRFIRVQNRVPLTSSDMVRAYTHRSDVAATAVRLATDLDKRYQIDTLKGIVLVKAMGNNLGRNFHDILVSLCRYVIYSSTTRSIPTSDKDGDTVSLKRDDSGRNWFDRNAVDEIASYDDILSSAIDTVDTIMQISTTVSMVDLWRSMTRVHRGNDPTTIIKEVEHRKRDGKCEGLTTTGKKCSNNAKVVVIKDGVHRHYCRVHSK